MALHRLTHLSALIIAGVLASLVLVFGMQAAPLAAPRVPFANLALNGDFESGALTPWAANNAAASLALVTDTVHGGQYAVRVDNTSTGSYGAQEGDASNVITATAGRTYQWSAWIYVMTGTNPLNTARMRVAWYTDYAAGQLSTSDSVTVTIAQQGTWTQVTGQATAPATSAVARLRLVVASTTGGSTASAIFDDVTFEELASTDTPTPTETDTPAPTSTDTPVPTSTDTPVPTNTNTATPTRTNTATPTNTNTPMPTNTNTATPTGTCAPWEWQAGPTVTPARYYFQGALAADGKFYVAGGHTANTTVVSRTEVFDPATNVWTTLAGMQVPVGQAALASDGTKLYVAGGFTGGSGTTTAVTTTVQIYDIGTDTWSLGPALEIRTEAAAGAVLNDKFYVIGGDDYTNGYTSTLVLDLGTMLWSHAAPLPVVLTNANATVVNGSIYLFGGMVNATTAAQTLYRYDPGPNTWTQLASVTGVTTIGNYTGISGYGPGRLLAAGGGNTAFTPARLTFVYDIAADTWSAGPQLLQAHMGHPQAQLPDGRVLVVSGLLTAGAGTTTSTELLPPLGASCATPTPTSTPTPSPTPRRIFLPLVRHSEIQPTATPTPTRTPTPTFTPTVTATPACLDPYEPNNSFAEAWPQPPTAPPLSLNLHAQFCPGETNDYYRFRLDAPGSIHVLLSDIPVGQGADYGVYMYDSNQAYVYGAYVPHAAQQEFTFGAGQAGTYYIQVHVYANPSEQPYHLQVP